MTRRSETPRRDSWDVNNYDLPLDLGPGGPIVGNPLAMRLALGCPGEHRLVQLDGDVASFGRLSTLRLSGHGPHAVANLARPLPLTC